MNNIINMKKGHGIFLGYYFWSHCFLFPVRRNRLRLNRNLNSLFLPCKLFLSRKEVVLMFLLLQMVIGQRQPIAHYMVQKSQSSGGPGNVTLKLTASANNTGASREAIVTINASNGDTRQIEVTQPEEVNEDLEAKFARVSPKLLTNNGNPLLDFMFTADPTAIEYNGRIYVYATNDHQQYEKVGKDGKNSSGYIRTLVMMSSADMVNWTYHGVINTAKLAPWTLVLGTFH